MPFGSEPPQLLRRKLFYQGRKFAYEVNRLRLPNKVEGEFECVRHPGGALVIPVTPEGKLVLVRQYRFTVKSRILEFPAGTVEEGEDPVATVEREIQEETGYKAAEIEKLGEFFLAPGYSDEIIYAFLGKGLEQLEQPPEQDDDEDIEVVLMTPEEVEQAILSGDLADAKSISAFVIARSKLMGS
ncbi:MAG: NUDIX hydrolase [Alkalinema sp. CACIAM 70d]|nr:MAG: NUDIX hydrolase [Alkalinema sp. CACIAM 70d]